MSGVLLRDLVSIPDAVHAGDFVLGLAKGIGEKSTITEYVVTPQLAADFDQALGVIKSAVETGASRAAYLDGSFGSGKSHFMAVLHAILTGDADARGKKGLADTVARHDPWLRGRKFLLVPYHLPDSRSLDAAILGGYVKHVLKAAPDAPVPSVYRDDQLLDDARDDRRRLGDEAFIAQLPASAAGDEEWEETVWTPAALDQAFRDPPGGADRRRLVGDLLAGPYRRYVNVVRADSESYIALDEGLSVISSHAKNVLGCDAIVLLLDELVLWLAGYIGDPAKVSLEAQKVSKLIESADFDRPAPVISFVPRQRDLRDLVSPSQAGNEVTSLFDTLKYWDGRFDRIALDDRNLPAIVSQRLLKPKDAAAKTRLDEVFAATKISPPDWEVLLNTHGERGTKEEFRLTYPFSPAFVHAMVDISGALQRERTALKLMQQLLVDYRDALPAGQLMPLGAIFDVLTQGADRPFTDKLRDEFDQAKRFYTQRVRPYLLAKHGLDAGQGASAPPKAFRADDLIVKTLLLAALVPNVPALNGLTASRLAGLNHGSIASMIPNQERRQVTATLRALGAQFGEIRLSGNEDDLRVDLALIGVDTEAIIAASRHVDNPGARRRLVRDLLWQELGLSEQGTFETRTDVVWRGTARAVDLVTGNVGGPAQFPSAQFQADPGTIRMVIDYPFDETGQFPREHARRVEQVKEQLGDTGTLVWLPHFLSEDRLADLSTLIVIDHLLERDRLAEATPNLTGEDRHQARMQLESRRSALTTRLTDALRRAYGVHAREAADLAADAPDSVLSLAHGFEPRLQVGQGIRGAFDRLCFALLDHQFPRHPDLSDPHAPGSAVRPAELTVVLETVDQASQHERGRYEVPRVNIPTVRKIANPLTIGEMHEAAFVLSPEWPAALSRKAGAAPEVTVRQLRSWIEEAQPGLPALVQNLLISCYAIQADKAWIRGGRVTQAPDLKNIPDDMALRSQELPSPAEFEQASVRGAGIFRITREPVRTARSVHALAEKIRRNAAGRLQPTQSLTAELRQHAATLGLDDSAPRMVTAKSLSSVLAALAAGSGDTETLRLLAGAGLEKDNAIYLAHLENTESQLGAARGANWQLLDAFAGRADDPEAAAIVSVLRQNAARDEHEVALAGPLRRASQAALDLMMERDRSPAVGDAGGAADARGAGVASPESSAVTVPPAGRTVVRARGRDGAARLAALRETMAANPDAEFEVSWQIVNG